jgi:hypothetical protein
MNSQKCFALEGQTILACPFRALDPWAHHSRALPHCHLVKGASGVNRSKAVPMNRDRFRNPDFGASRLKFGPNYGSDLLDGIFVRFSSAIKRLEPCNCFRPDNRKWYASKAEFI